MSNYALTLAAPVAAAYVAKKVIQHYRKDSIPSATKMESDTGF
jgi:uncharacterized membrane protein YebE (DUF533 family)